MKLLLDSLKPCAGFKSYTDLLKVSKENVSCVQKALTATVDTDIKYTGYTGGKCQSQVTSGWIKKEDKYIEELTRPSGQTGKWITKLKTLCEDFQNIESENEIVPGLQKIIDHCTYTADDPEKNDNLPLYMYRNVHVLYAEIALRLKNYSKFVTEEINNSHKHQKAESNE